MKKRLSWILLPVFAIALLLGLASCSNAYSGNYKEVTAEDLTAVEEKLANAEVEAPKTTGVAVSKINNDDENGVMAILRAKHPNAF